jgi:hypothetical protein
VLREYLESREKEVVTIMMSLFDEEQIMKVYLKDHDKETEKETERRTAKKLLRKGKMSLDDIADCVPTLTLEELKELEAEIKQLA